MYRLLWQGNWAENQVQETGKARVFFRRKKNSKQVWRSAEAKEKPGQCQSYHSKRFSFIWKRWVSQRAAVDALQIVRGVLPRCAQWSDFESEGYWISQVALHRDEKEIFLLETEGVF